MLPGISTEVVASGRANNDSERSMSSDGVLVVREHLATVNLPPLMDVRSAK